MPIKNADKAKWNRIQVDASFVENEVSFDLIMATVTSKLPIMQTIPRKMLGHTKAKDKGGVIWSTSSSLELLANIINNQKYFLFDLKDLLSCVKGYKARDFSHATITKVNFRTIFVIDSFKNTPAQFSFRGENLEISKSNWLFRRLDWTGGYNVSKLVFWFIIQHPNVLFMLVDSNLKVWESVRINRHKIDIFWIEI